MRNFKRVTVYYHQNGTKKLTPRQHRRIVKKKHKTLNVNWTF